MTRTRPWEVDDPEERWDGYLITPGSPVLKNLVNATTVSELRAAENDLLEARLAELRSTPSLVSRTYDALHLQQIHRHLFQDVYEWAGDLRTVGLRKGDGEAFIPPMEIELPLRHVAERISESDCLRDRGRSDLPQEIAYLYDYANFAHPFREGNGRAQREFFDELMAESGHGLDWTQIDMEQLHDACHRARNDDDSGPLITLFTAILTDDPAY